MRFENRPFTKKQINELEAYIAFHVQLIRSIMFLVVAAIIGAIFHSIQLKFYEGFPYWLIPTLFISALLYFYAKRWTGGRDFRNQIREDLKEGYARVISVEPVDVIEVEELEDEGPSFIIKTHSGDTLLLTGQYLDKAKARKFPWERFELIEAPRSSVFFELKKAGEAMSISSKRPPFTYEVAKQLGCFERNYVILDKEAIAIALALALET